MDERIAKLKAMISSGTPPKLSKDVILHSKRTGGVRCWRWKRRRLTIESSEDDSVAL
jgi:hypothetical protein